MSESTEEKKIEVTHHIVYSTKGGCGKTAFSLFLTLCDNFKYDNDLSVMIPQGKSVSTVGKHYFIDLDLLGSSIEYYLRINRSMEESGECQISTPTLQGLVRGDIHTYDVNNLMESKRKLKGHIQFGGCVGSGICNKVYIIPTSASEKEKAMFHVKKGTTPLLRYEELEAQLSDIQQSILIRNLNEANGNSKDVHFMYDLAPNADSYTDAVINEIFNRVRDKKTNEKVILYLVSNSPEMLNCNIDWLNRLMCGNEKFTCSVVLVNNDNVGEFGDYNKAFASIKIAATKVCKCSKSVVDMIKAHFFFEKESIPMSLFRYKDKVKKDERVIVYFDKIKLAGKTETTGTAGAIGTTKQENIEKSTYHRYTTDSFNEKLQSVHVFSNKTVVSR